MPSGARIFAFFCSARDLYRVEFSHGLAPQRRRPDAAACPHLVEADIGCPRRSATFRGQISSTKVDVVKLLPQMTERDQRYHQSKDEFVTLDSSSTVRI